MKLIAVLCVLCACVSAWALDREAFTIAKYDLDIHIDPEQQRLGARGKITLRNDSAQPQKIVALQISSSLNWRSIRVAGKPVQFVSQPYTSDIDHTGALSEAVVTLPSAINPKESIEIEIGYEGIVALDATRLTRIGVPDELAKHTSWDQIGPRFAAVRGAGYVTWYPIATESADFSEGNSLFEVGDRWRSREAGSDFKLALSVTGAASDPPLTLLCGAQSGGSSAKTEPSNLKGEPHDGSEKRSVKCDWSPLGTITPTFVMAEYVDLSKAPLKLFSLDGHEAGASKYANALEPAMKFVSGWFGTPSAPVAIADFADSHSSPYESGTMLLASMASDDSKLAGINLVHELAHSALPSSRPWVYEGLAHFAEAMYRQDQGGRQAALDFLSVHRGAFLDSEKEVAASAGKNKGQPLSSTFDETYYRSKAAYVWWMLHDMIGDEALKAAIGKYRAADDQGPKYVQQLIEAASKRDLGWFFEDWVYFDRGLPDFRVQSVHPWVPDKATDKGVQFITLTLENLGSAGADLPFTVSYEGGEIRDHIEIRAKATATTRVQLPAAASQIVINDGSVPESDLTNNVFQIPPP
jgi:hypothetical protein